MTDPLPAPLSGSWLSYTEAGERLGMSAEAVRTKARRAGWRRMPGNDGEDARPGARGADEQPPGRYARPRRTDRDAARSRRTARRATTGRAVKGGH